MRFFGEWQAWMWVLVVGLGVLGAPPAWASVELPAGAEMTIKLIDKVSTEDGATGDTFRAVLDEGLRIGRGRAVLAGAPVRGVVRNLVRPTRVRRLARVSVQLTHLEVNGRQYEIESSITEFRIRRDGTLVAEATMGAYAGGAAGVMAGAMVTDDPEKVRKLQAIGATAGAIFGGKRQHIEFIPGQTLDFLLAEAVAVDLPASPIRPDRPRGDRVVHVPVDRVVEVPVDRVVEVPVDRVVQVPVDRVVHVPGGTDGPLTLDQICAEFPDLEECEAAGESWWSRIVPRIGFSPFWTPLALHSLLAILALGFVWYRSTRGAWVGAMRLRSQKLFWIGFLVASGVLVLLGAGLVWPSGYWHSLRWLGGGALGVALALGGSKITGIFGGPGHTWRKGAGVEATGDPAIPPPPPPPPPVPGGPDLGTSNDW